MEECMLQARKEAQGTSMPKYTTRRRILTRRETWVNGRVAQRTLLSCRLAGIFSSPAYNVAADFTL